MDFIGLQEAQSLVNGLTGSKFQAGQSTSPEPLVRVSGGSCPTVITVSLTLSVASAGPLPLNQFLEAGNLFYVLAEKFLVFS